MSVALLWCGFVIPSTLRPKIDDTFAEGSASSWPTLLGVDHVGVAHFCRSQVIQCDQSTRAMLERRLSVHSHPALVNFGHTLFLLLPTCWMSLRVWFDTSMRCHVRSGFVVWTTITTITTTIMMKIQTLCETINELLQVGRSPAGPAHHEKIHRVVAKLRFHTGPFLWHAKHRQQAVSLAWLLGC